MSDRFLLLSGIQQGFFEAVAFTEFHADNEELDGMTFDDIAITSVDCVCKVIDEWSKKHTGLVDRAMDGDGCEPMDETQIGHDLWLTSNGHGTGFWDRGMGTLGEELSEAAKELGESNVYLGDDGKVYID